MLRCIELLEKVCIDNGICPDNQEKKIINDMFKFFEMAGKFIIDWDIKRPLINNGIEKIRGVYEKGYFNIDDSI